MLFLSYFCSSKSKSNNTMKKTFLLALMFFVLAIYLRSNAVDKVKDPNAVDIELELFHTDRSFNIGAVAVIVILAILYTALW